MRIIQWFKGERVIIVERRWGFALFPGDTLLSKIFGFSFFFHQEVD